MNVHASNDDLSNRLAARCCAFGTGSYAFEYQSFELPGRLTMPSRLLSLTKSVSFWIVTGVTLLGLVIGLVVWGIDPNPNELLSVASQSQSRVRINEISCLSIEPRQMVFEQKEYWDPKLIETIANILSVRTVLVNAEYSTCRWGLTVSGGKRLVSAVRYDGRVARYAVAAAICERTPDGRMNPSRCLSKNIYIFNPRVETLELFSLALAGLAKSQTNKWIVFESRRFQ